MGAMFESTENVTARSLKLHIAVELATVDTMRAEHTTVSTWQINGVNNIKISRQCGKTIRQVPLIDGIVVDAACPITGYLRK